VLVSIYCYFYMCKLCMECDREEKLHAFASSEASDMTICPEILIVVHDAFNG